MKKLKYLLIFILGVSMFTSCFKDETELDLNDDGLNVVTFARLSSNMLGVTDGNEYNYEFKVKLSGPTAIDITNNITVTVEVANGTTAATDGSMFVINNPSFVLTPENNFLGFLDITLKTEGNTPPMEGTPEFEDYVAPVLHLKLTATGDPMVTGSGNTGVFTLNYSAPNPYAGDYKAELHYFHPTAGGSYPDDPYTHETNDKTLVAVTGRKAETGFSTWYDNNLCWITINADNSIKFEVADTWSYDVKLGDPNDASKISHYDPATGIIYLYYHYSGTGGNRIFWEVFTPVP